MGGCPQQGNMLLKTKGTTQHSEEGRAGLKASESLPGKEANGHQPLPTGNLRKIPRLLQEKEVKGLQSGSGGEGEASDSGEAPKFVDFKERKDFAHLEMQQPECWGKKRGETSRTSG